MISYKKDDKQSDQSVKQSKDKNDTKKKTFDPVEYLNKKLQEKGIPSFKKVKPPKDRCRIIFRR
jgi:hypothetical protein